MHSAYSVLYVVCGLDPMELSHKYWQHTGCWFWRRFTGNERWKNNNMSLERSRQSVVGYALTHPFSWGKLPLRYAIAKWFGQKVVVLTDFDGEETYRIVYYSPSGQAYATRMSFGVCEVRLKPDGTVCTPRGNITFVKTWREV